MEIRPILSALLRTRTAPLLVVIQIALTLAILVNALYVVNLRQAVATRPSGIAAEADVFYVTARPVRTVTHQEAMAQQQRDVEVLRALPGVTAASWTNQIPMSRSGSTSGFSLDRKQARQSIELATYFVPPGFADTLGLALVEGRDLAAGDMVEFDAEHDTFERKFADVLVLTRAAAAHLFPGTSAVGKTLYFGTGDDATAMRVIGVVDRLQTPQAEATDRGEYSALIPLALDLTYPRLAVRAAPGERDRVMAAAEAAIRAASLTPRIVSVRSVEEGRALRYRNERALAWMLVTVSVLLLLVTASGIVGMTMLRIAQRRKQIGVRRALGARRADIVRHFVTENVLVTTAGIAAGVVLALLLNQLLVSHLELTRLPIVYLVTGALVLWLLGIVAVSGPAWRAAAIPPATATRSV